MQILKSDGKDNDMGLNALRVCDYKKEAQLNAWKQVIHILSECYNN